MYGKNTEKSIRRTVRGKKLFSPITNPKSTPHKSIEIDIPYFGCISVDTFEDFELELEWKLQSGGNSGIFYFASEEGDYIWQSAPEMQVLDNLGHQDRFRKVTSAGALYDLIAPLKEMVKPIGEFNKVKIISKNKEIEHWLNGEKIVEYKVGSEHIQNLISKSKFNSMPLFFKSSSGHIGLQGDHGEVWYRNIRIRKL